MAQLNGPQTIEQLGLRTTEDLLLVALLTRPLRRLDINYSAMRMPSGLRESAALERMRAYLLRLLDRATERLEKRVEDRLTERLDATHDILADPGLLDDLRQADSQADEDARPYDEIRRDLGLA